MTAAGPDGSNTERLKELTHHGFLDCGTGAPKHNRKGTYNDFLDSAISARRHWKQGVYVCQLDGMRNPPGEMICTLRPKRNGNADKTGEMSEPGCICCPPGIACESEHGMLRPWNPHSCVIAAAICCNFVFFSVRAGTYIFAIGCSLEAMSHIADIIGPNGRLIGVIDNRMGPLELKAGQLASFLKIYPWATVIQADVETATLESYERQLSLPLAMKNAFLMALHPRLGTASPAKKLAADPTALTRRIFSFLECYDVAKVNCLFVSHWPVNTHIATIRKVILSHTRILRRWRSSRKAGVNAGAGAPSMDRENLEDAPEDVNGATAGGADGAARAASSAASAAGGAAVDEAAAADSAAGACGAGGSKSRHQESAGLSIFVDVPIDHIPSARPCGDRANKLMKVRNAMKRLPNGRLTGLLPKEELLLEPYFPGHGYVLFKHRAGALAH